MGASGGKERVRALILSACLRNGYQGNVVAHFFIASRPRYSEGVDDLSAVAADDGNGIGRAQRKDPRH